VVFNEDTIFDGRVKDLMDNLMHSTLEEIATYVRTIELLTLSINLEIDSFYKDDSSED
jgi:hypothetical protein